MKKNKTNKKPQQQGDNLIRYLAITEYIDGKYRNDFFSIEKDSDVEKIGEHILHMHDQLNANDKSPDPVVKEIKIIELTKIHIYNDLDKLFNDAKSKFIESKKDSQ